MSIFKGLVVKEFREAFRDKRAIMAALFAIVTGPIIMAAVLMFQLDEQLSVKDSYVEFVGEENAPELINYLKAQQFKPIEEVPESEAAKWKEREIVLTISDDFAERLNAGKPAKITIKADYSDKNLRTTLERIETIINAYSSQIGTTRLLMRGIDPRITQPITIDVQSTATPESTSGLLMGLVGMFIMMALFTASMTASIDTSAGERERHSLELILCQPVSTVKVVLSKVVCVSVYGGIASILTMFTMSFTMSMLPMEKLGISIIIDPVTMIYITLMIIPLAYLAGIAQLFFAYQAKSFKEAQSYLSMILLLPMLVPMAVTIMPHKPAWLDYVPLAGQNIIMGDLYKGESLDIAAFAFTNISTLAVAVAMTLLLARSLRSEKVVLGLS
ncbi:ABC transporter permease [Psychrobium sp. MM17-31]|uniref:ABC transporter permease n=1 Tax=Psychrobium sp. MM17-31 TaxID=2917758 RepID=UPI001EF4E80F|nr:ABC transporter permease [Psychrobium sp. MM17-31]MCG7530652.1 ABC transporter permease [Psychrobium sp. MM17-31]